MLGPLITFVGEGAICDLRAECKVKAKNFGFTLKKIQRVYVPPTSAVSTTSNNIIYNYYLDEINIKVGKLSRL